MDFDWDLAIKRNSEALTGIIAALFAMLGLDGTDGVGRIPPALRRAVLQVLRPAESAVRPLIVIAARGLVVKLAPSRPMPKGQRIGKGQVIGKGGAPRASSFQLFDTRKDIPELRPHRIKYAKHPPRIHVFPYHSLVADRWPARPAIAAPAPPSDGLVNASRLSRRLQILKLVLDDLPRQARRMARWRVRREAMTGPTFKPPLRQGQAPGHRKRQIHPIDEVLAECHWLAWEAMKPDTS